MDIRGLPSEVILVRICVIGGSNIRFMPYLHYYEGILKEAGADYDIYYWNRFAMDEDYPNSLSFDRLDGGSRLTRLLGYLAYRRFLLNQLTREAYDIYIVLTMQVGVILSDFLKKKNYVLDIRDYSHEDFPPYRAISRRLVQGSCLTCISSDAFKRWLPRNKPYVVSHNMRLEDLDNRCSPFNRETKIVSFIGTIRYMDANVRFLEMVRGITDLKIRYIGAGPCENELRDYCRYAGIENVEFFGPFSPEDRSQYFQDTNFVLSCYGNRSKGEKTLLPNRLYDSCIHKRPIIVNEGTYLAEVVNQNGIGIVVQLDDPGRFVSQMEKYYDTRYYDEYALNCEALLSSVVNDIEHFRASVRQALSEVITT